MAKQGGSTTVNGNRSKSVRQIQDSNTADAKGSCQRSKLRCHKGRPRKLHKLLEQGGRTRVTSAQEATLVRVGILE